MNSACVSAAFLFDSPILPATEWEIHPPHSVHWGAPRIYIPMDVGKSHASRAAEKGGLQTSANQSDATPSPSAHLPMHATVFFTVHPR
jgi:hypothetical protein